MTVLTVNENDIMFFKNDDRYDITSYIVDKIQYLTCKKILYFNYSYSEEELLSNFKILNNKNIIIIDKYSVTIDDLEKYIVYSKPNYICIDYFRLIDKNHHLYINDKKLKYVLDKLAEYTKKYNVFFIAVINMEDK